MTIASVKGKNLKIFPIGKTSSLSFLEKLFIFLIVITSGTDIYMDSSIPLYCLVLVFILLVMTKRIQINSCGKQILLGVLIFFIWTIQCLDYYGDITHIEYVVKYTALLLSMLLFAVGTKEKTKECLEQFIKYVFVLSIISSILFFLVVLGINLPTISTATHQGTTVYYLEHYSFNPFYGLWGYRNSGIYWEPGMYQIYLNLLLIYFLYKKEGIKPLVRYLIAAYLVILVLTTGSVSGYLLCVIIIALYALNNSNHFFVKMIILALVVVGIVMFLPYLDSMLNNKMSIGHSYKYRMSDITLGWEIFKTKPIFGFGVVNDKYAQVSQANFGVNRGDSNGIMNILISFGIVGLFAYVVQLVSFLKYMSLEFSKYISIALIAWLLVSMSTEPIATHTFVFYILGIGLCHMGRIKYVRGKQSNQSIC